MPKVSREHVEARRAQILEGARRAFSRHGYEGATVARIEEETGLSRGAIFNYFDGKLDLFVQLARDVNRHYIELLVERGIDDAIREMAHESPEWLGVMLEAQAKLHHDPEFLRRMEPPAGQLQQVQEWFRARQEDGTFRSDLAVADLARFANIVLNGLALRVISGDETDAESVVRLLNDALSPRS
ncbi:MAG TPA: helix-turn-helix domain-containing protein [Gaiellaceae bacterium]|nr:helix-turn-helix domain-containing protein [Gaiellaceae bacterium]